MSTLFVRVDYEEYKPETYNGVYVTDHEVNKIIQINTNNFEFDYAMVLQFISEYQKYNKEIKNVARTSSIDHYAMDRNSAFENDEANTKLK